MRKLILLLVFGLITAACGGAETTPDLTEATAAPTTADVAGTEAPPASPSVDGPPAPDFELVLADGGSFSLADEQKPTYMVFWAEW